MNICMIAPSPSGRDGIAHFSFELAKRLKEDGNQVTLLTPFASSLQKEIVQYPLISLNPFHLFQILKVLQLRKIDVIHVQYAVPTYGLLAIQIWMIVLLAKTLLHCRIIVNLHEVKRETDLLRHTGRVYFYVLSRISDRILVHTEEAKKILITRCYVLPNKVTVLPLFIDPAQRTAVHSVSENNQNDELQITYFGYIHTDKGIEYLIEAINHLTRDKTMNGVAFKCIIAGDVRPRKGIFRFFEQKDINYKKYLLSQVRQRKLEEFISFEGFVEQNKVPILLKNSAMFILPYTNTEQSGVLHSVLPYKKPIIATNIGGLKETLNEVGILVPPKDAIAIANSIKQLVLDTSFYHKISESYQELLHTHSIEMISKKLAVIYSKES